MAELIGRQHRTRDAHTTTDTAGPTPGKRTLVEQIYGAPVQARGRVAGEDSDVHAAAARGVATPSSPLPFGDRIQRLFGRHDLSSVQAHSGRAAEASVRDMGAEAYATGNHVVLGKGADLFTVAHEAAHVVQQRAGVHLSGGVGAEGDPYEVMADAVAARVVAGQSAEDLLGAPGAAAGPTAVQQRRGTRKLRKPHKTERQALATAKRNPSVENDQDTEHDAEPEAVEAPGLDEERDETAKIYDGHLQTAIGLLLGLQGGEKLRFPEPKTKQYNKANWVKGKVHEDGEFELVLKKGVKPSAAIDDLFANVAAWGVDCAEFIQVAHWYALRHTLGTEEFDKHIAADDDDVRMTMRDHGSTGLSSAYTYDRDAKGDPFKCTDEATDQETTVAITEDELLARLPIGSRVMFTDGGLGEDDEESDFESENAIKIGEDRYAAHPYGIVTAQQLRHRLAGSGDGGELMSMGILPCRPKDFLPELEWQGAVSEAVRAALTKMDGELVLSPKATIKVRQAGRSWIIRDEKEVYLIDLTGEGKDAEFEVGKRIVRYATEYVFLEQAETFART
jgi:Domain of unknown function (DUF4157)/Protein-glutamine gamma-glutamyltransferase